MLSMMRTLPPRQQRLAKAERHSARTVDKAHGRLETRTLVSTSQLDEDYLDFPGAAQCFKLTRTRTLRDRHRRAQDHQRDGLGRHVALAPTSRRRPIAGDRPRPLGDRKQSVPRPRSDAGRGRLPRTKTLCPRRLLNPEEQRAQRAANPQRQEPGSSTPNLLCRPRQGPAGRPS